MTSDAPLSFLIQNVAYIHGYTYVFGAQRNQSVLSKHLVYRVDGVLVARDSHISQGLLFLDRMARTRTSIRAPRSCFLEKLTQTQVLLNASWYRASHNFILFFLVQAVSNHYGKVLIQHIIMYFGETLKNIFSYLFQTSRRM